MIDYCKCIYCGEEFDGSKACNYDMDADVVKCPECKKEMGVRMSIEFECYEVNK